jgi:hypothetical protein
MKRLYLLFPHIQSFEKQPPPMPMGKILSVCGTMFFLAVSGAAYAQTPSTPSAQPAVPSSPAVGAPAPKVRQYPSAYSQPSVAFNDATEPKPGQTVHVINNGLVISGAIIFAISWGLAVEVSINLGDNECSYCSEDKKVANVIWIPIAGPIIAGAVDDENDTGLSLALDAWSIVQAAGLTMAIIGLVGRNVPTDRRKANSLKVELVPVINKGRAGLLLHGSF